MVPREECEEPARGVALGSDAVDGGDDVEMKLLTVNVDGLGAYALSPAERLEEILTTVLAWSPDVLLLQEVVREMHAVLQHRLQGWRLQRRRRHAEEFQRHGCEGRA